MQYIDLGSVIIVALSAEVVAEYTQFFKDKFPNKTVIPVGYINTPFGYLPTQKILREGGYEAIDHFDSFSIIGNFNKDPFCTVASISQF